MARQAGANKRGVSLIVFHRGIRAPLLQQVPSHVPMTTAASHVKRCIPTMVGTINGSSLLHQESGDIQCSCLACQIEWRLSSLVGEVQGGPSFRQETSHLGMGMAVLTTARAMKGCHPVLVLKIDILGTTAMDQVLDRGQMAILTRAMQGSPFSFGLVANIGPFVH
eukprot:CAMPEP_0168854712 /NCGR_PEP_ID=MMETSP0727-20121128/14237_1 /TAXON_ID=265536 /ORGANISM="Amphiprora sp., Strain CCMP467" /LENGTH=165 /DNA_ID=CAMNT_0008909081 /DNA_START=171 /DNA_END=668 /DNA_ORIENTATION=+